MGDGVHIDPDVVARRCSVKTPEYSELTSLDWVVLDFTDGMRSFSQMLDILPVDESALAEAYLHFRLLGFLTWKRPEPRGDVNHAPIAPTKAVTQTRPSSMPTFSGYSDEVCANYIPARMFAKFRSFTPQLFDIKLDLPTEVQAFIEFIHDHLNEFSPYELLGVPEGTRNESAIRQGFMTRTRQFHPDRYFRKNVGPFGPRISAIFKAISTAYAQLQSPT